ncbi:MAG: hypothetical protein JWQ74_1099 [Marmoricola sp.]|nr:hypothetical protein [Marmoricola sp.]
MAVTEDVTTRRVPVEHRLLGLDKRSFPYALFAVAVFLVATVLIPRIDDALDWDDPVQAGEQLALTDTLAFVPTTGWNVVRGVRLEGAGIIGSGPAAVTSDGVTLTILTGEFDGTPQALVTQIEKVTRSTDDPSFTISADTRTLTTDAGDVGVVQTYSSLTGDGLVAAFVIDGTGVRVTAYGPPAQLHAAAEEIDAMIASIRTVERGTR